MSVETAACDGWREAATLPYLSFFHWPVIPPVSQFKLTYMCGSVSGSYSVALVCLSIPCHYHTKYYGFIITFDTWKGKSPHLIQSYLGSSWSLFFTINFRLNLLNSIENTVGILIRITLNLGEYLQRIDFLYLVESFYPEDGVILYLFISFVNPSIKLWSLCKSLTHVLWNILLMYFIIFDYLYSVLFPLLLLGTLLIFIC